MNYYVLHTGHSRWVGDEGLDFLKKSAFNVLVTNSFADHKIRENLYHQVVELHKNHYGTQGAQSAHNLSLPAAEIYSIGLSVFLAYFKYTVLPMRGFLFCGHTDTCYDFDSLKKVYEAHPFAKSFVWARTTGNDLEDGIATIHSDAFILKLHVLTPADIGRLLATHTTELNAEHFWTVALSALGEMAVIDYRDRYQINKRGFVHRHQKA